MGIHVNALCMRIHPWLSMKGHKYQSKVYKAVTNTVTIRRNKQSRRLGHWQKNSFNDRIFRRETGKNRAHLRWQRSNKHRP